MVFNVTGVKLLATIAFTLELMAFFGVAVATAIAVAPIELVAVFIIEVTLFVDVLLVTALTFCCSCFLLLRLAAGFRRGLTVAVVFVAVVVVVMAANVVATTVPPAAENATVGGIIDVVCPVPVTLFKSMVLAIFLVMDAAIGTSELCDVGNGCPNNLLPSCGINRSMVPFVLLLLLPLAILLFPFTLTKELLSSCLRICCACAFISSAVGKDGIVIEYGGVGLLWPLHVAGNPSP